MVKFKTEVDKINLYAIILKNLGKEKKETTFQTPYGAVSLREWDGIVLKRGVEYDFDKKIYILKDEVDINEKKFPDLVKKFKEELKKVI